MLGFDARIWSTSLLNAVVISWGERLLHTSFVPRCIMTMSGLVGESQPGSWFWFAMFTARKPPFWFGSAVMGGKDGDLYVALVFSVVGETAALSG
jgi:hypothetical protein